MEKPDSVSRQREFYGQGSHEHLRAREHDHYARKIVDRLAGVLEMGPEHRVLEVGAGFGRFCRATEAAEHRGARWNATMIQDALAREESCGGHFRDEHQTDENEALRRDDEFAYGAAWEHQGVGQPGKLHREYLSFENVKLTMRSYK